MSNFSLRCFWNIEAPFLLLGDTDLIGVGPWSLSSEFFLTDDLNKELPKCDPSCMRLLLSLELVRYSSCVVLVDPGLI